MKSAKCGMRSLMVLIIIGMLMSFHANAIDRYIPAKGDIIKVTGLPAVGKWMISPQNGPANWIGEKYKGKSMKEPINIIIVDRKAVSIYDAKARLAGYMKKAGFKDRGGHSSGYKGYIAGKVYDQLPSEKDHAYSDGWYVFDNDHARLFGPYRNGNDYVFIGAFSREIVGFYKRELTHKYGSFVKARDAFAKNAKEHTDLKNASLIRMGSNIDNASTTTGDHDGKAVLLRN